jgi:hypothetical protein
MASAVGMDLGFYRSGRLASGFVLRERLFPAWKVADGQRRVVKNRAAPL